MTNVTSVTLAEATTLISTCGANNTFIFQGEPGIGKSAMLTGLGHNHPSDYVYIDCALLDLGDLQMPVPATDRKSVGFVPNDMFHVDSKTPITIMLDEIGKASRPVQNALLTLLHEHRVGSHKLPKGSTVFGTTNMSSDGVGDSMQAHAKNRVTYMKINKPTHEEWIPWAAGNGVEPEILAWVNEYPHCLESYSDTEGDDNPYIFNPKKQQEAFVSPRSLFNASNLVKNRDKFSSSVLISALSGTIGESAAKDMQAFITVADSLPSWSQIMANPAMAPVSNNPIANAILAMGAVMKVKHETAPKWMEYNERLPKEVQMLFASHVARSKNAAAMMTCLAFTNWCLANKWAV